MRAGATVTSGGSRCHSTYGVRDGAWYRDDFDEGYETSNPSSELDVRRMIVGEPELFRGVLHAQPWSRFVSAFVADDWAAARVALVEASAYRDPEQRRDVWEAYFDWPARSPSAALRDRLAQHLVGHTAWHLFMDATGWARTRDNAARGLAFAERIAAMIGEVPGLHALRAHFHELRDDRPAQRGALAAEIAALPEGHAMRRHCEALLAKLSQALG
jgi:hypothetical protein